MDAQQTGIADAEMARLEDLSAKVVDALFEVTQRQAIVDALKDKSAQFGACLQEAVANRQSALDNLNLAREIEAAISGLASSTQFLKKQTDKAAESASKPPTDMATMICKLIFTVDVIEKLAQLVNKQKSSNPLIPDALISCMTKACSDANHAIELCLVALQSCVASETSALRVQQMVDLQNEQITVLNDQFEKTVATSTANAARESGILHVGSELGFLALSQHVCQAFEQKYQQAMADDNTAKRQLAHAQQTLLQAKIRLNSDEAGLATAKALAAVTYPDLPQGIHP